MNRKNCRKLWEESTLSRCLSTLIQEDFSRRTGPFVYAGPQEMEIGIGGGTGGEVASMSEVVETDFCFFAQQMLWWFFKDKWYHHPANK